MGFVMVGRAVWLRACLVHKGLDLPTWQCVSASRVLCPIAPVPPRG